jgi:chemotaxis protein CheC
MAVEIKLNEAQRDALKEIGNIGSAHAATALAQMLEKKVMISVPRLKAMSKADAALMADDPDTLVAGILMHVLGDATARIFFMVPRKNAILMSDLLLKNPAGSTKVLNELGHSSLKETGNILASQYLNATSEFLGLLMVPSVPNLSFDIAGAILESGMDDFESADGVIYCVENDVSEEADGIQAKLLFVPDEASLPVLFEAAGLKG